MESLGGDIRFNWIERCRREIVGIKREIEEALCDPDRSTPISKYCGGLRHLRVDIRVVEQGRCVAGDLASVCAD